MIQYYVNPENVTEITAYSGTERIVTLPDGREITPMPPDADGTWDLWPQGTVAPYPTWDYWEYIYTFTGNAVNVTYEQRPIP